MTEHPQGFDHVGLPVNEPPGTSRVALHLVFRRLAFNFIVRAECQSAPTPSHYCPALNGNSKSIFSTTRNTGRNAKIPGQKARILSCVSGRWIFSAVSWREGGGTGPFSWDTRPADDRVRGDGATRSPSRC